MLVAETWPCTFAQLTPEPLQLAVIAFLCSGSHPGSIPICPFPGLILVLQLQSPC